MATAVLLPTSLVVLHTEGLLLAEADSADAVGRNAQRNDVLLDRGGAAIAEAQVVFRGTTLVAVAFDGYFEAWIVFQEIPGLRKCSASVGTNFGLEIGRASCRERGWVAVGGVPVDMRQ